MGRYAKVWAAVSVAWSFVLGRPAGAEERPAATTEEIRVDGGIMAAGFVEGPIGYSGVAYTYSPDGHVGLELGAGGLIQRRVQAFQLRAMGEAFVGSASDRARLGAGLAVWTTDEAFVFLAVEVAWEHRFGDHLSLSLAAGAMSPFQALEIPVLGLRASVGYWF